MAAIGVSRSCSAPGEPVELRPEPRNKADRNAVAVFYSRGVQISYVTAERAAWIGSKMGAGADILAVFQRQTDHGALTRINLEGEGPTLPAPPQPSSKSESEADESDFWPEYIPHDD